MATVFTQALAAPPQAAPEDSVYKQLMAELAAKPQVQPNMFTPEEIQQRIGQNNALTELGVVGQLAGADDVRNLGAGVFKKALADRQERVTNRGVQDPLTGQTAVDPEYAREQDDNRRGRILQQALAYEDRRTRAQEREADRQREHQYRLEEIRARAAQGKATDAEMQELKKELIRSQIAGNESRVDLANQKQQDKVDKARTAADMAAARAQDISKNIDAILERTGTFSTGLLGSALGKIPGTGAYDLRKDIDTIKANIGFQELQAMRQASPTGGALGQVAVQELNMLQAVLGNLDPNQSEDQLRDNLGKVKKHFDNWKNLMARAVPQDRSVPPAPGGGGAPVPTTPPAAPGAVPGGAPAAPALSPVDLVRQRLRNAGGM